MYNVTQNFDNHHRDSRGSRPSPRLAGLLLAIAAIAVLLIMPTAPTAAQATEVTLVKNTGQTSTTWRTIGSNTSAGTLQWVAQPFTAGTESSGYKLASIGVLVRDIGDPPSNQSVVLAISAKVYEANTDPNNSSRLVPGTEVCALESPASIVASSLNTFTAPQTCDALKAGTQYMVEFDRDPSSNVTAQLRVAGTADDSGAAAGWSITSGYYRRGVNTSIWTYADNAKIQIEVKGAIVTATNNAATGAPTIDGTPAQGFALTANVSGISDTDGLPDDAQGYTYAWFRVSGGVETLIPGATAPRYYPSLEDVGKEIMLKVRFTDKADNPEEGPFIGAKVGPVTASDHTYGLWSGTLTVGSSGTQSGYVKESFGSVAPTTFKAGELTQEVVGLGYDGGLFIALRPNIRSPFKMLYGGDLTPLSSENATTSAGTGALEGATVYKWAGHSDPGWGDGHRIAFLLKTLHDSTTGATGAPTINGGAYVDQELSANTSGIADPNGLPDTFEYQWLRVDGANDTEIDGATSRTYMVSQDDMGKQIKVRVSFHDGGGFREGPLTSAATAVILGTLAEIDLNVFNDQPYGIWGNDTTIWVAEDSTGTANKLFAYNRSTGAHDSSKDIDALQAAGNTEPSGIWSNGTTMWVADNSTGTANKLFAYTLSTGARDSSKDIDSLQAAGNTDPGGIWSDGTTMWVADSIDDKLYAYTLSTGARDSSKDFATLSAAGNGSAEGIWSDGATMWVADRTDDKIYAYKMSDKAHDSAKDIDLDADNDDPRGIWSDGFSMFVVDATDDKIYFYIPSNAPTGAPVITGTPALGEVLSVDTSGIGDADGLSTPNFRYQWFQIDQGDEFEIPGATAKDYYPTNALVSDSLRVRVDFTDDADNEESLTSAVSGEVAFRAGVKVPWSATMDVGGSGSGLAERTGFSADYGSLSPASFDFAGATHTIDSFFFWGDALSVRFYVDPKIPGTFTVLHGSSGEVAPTLEGGHQFYFWGASRSPWARGTKVAFAMKIENSAATGRPTISGTATVGETLTAARGNIADANGLANPPGNLTYQWIRVDGGTETDIPGATSSTYELQADDVGKQIKVRLTFDDRAGFSEERTSLATAVIRGEPLDVANVGLLGEFGLHADNEGATGIWSDGVNTIWVGDAGDNKIYAYHWNTRARDSSKDIAAHGHLLGIWSDGATIWAVRSNPGTSKLFAYNLLTGAHAASKDIICLDCSGNGRPEGVWSDGATMWISDSDHNKIYAYNLSTRSRDASKEFNTLHAAGNRDAEGIWSDGVTMWVADSGDDKVYAYKMSDKSRDPGKDFDLDDDNGSPRGMWSDRSRMFVVDISDDKIYIYGPGGAPTDPDIVDPPITDPTDPTDPVDPVVTVTLGPERTLVSNAGQTFDSSPAPMNAGIPATAAGFATGNSNGGYTLSSFALRTATAADADHLTVTLNEATTDSSNNAVPGNAVCTLTNPARFEGAGLTTFAAPEECGTLAANTTYFAVLTRGASATWDVNYVTTGSDNEDSGKARGWSISNERLRQLSGSSDWGARSSTPVIEVRGRVITRTVTVDPSHIISRPRTSGSEGLAPRSLSAWEVDGGVELRWLPPREEADMVTGYEILRRQSVWGQPYSLLDPDTGSTNTKFIDATATQPVARYEYRVVAIRGTELSAWSRFASVFTSARPSATKTLVSNTGRTPVATASITQQYALGFRLGKHGQGYALDSVSLDLAAAPSSLTVSLWRGGVPGTTSSHGDAQLKIFEFTNPSSFRAGLNEFTAPPGAYVLPNVNYSIVLTDFGTSLSIRETTSDAESGVDDAIIWNTAKLRGTSSKGRWSQGYSTRGGVLRMALKGSERDRGILTSNLTQPRSAGSQEIISLGDEDCCFAWDFGKTSLMLLRRVSVVADDSTSDGGFFGLPWDGGNNSFVAQGNVAPAPKHLTVPAGISEWVYSQGYHGAWDGNRFSMTIRGIDGDNFSNDDPPVALTRGGVLLARIFCTEANAGVDTPSPSPSGGFVATGDVTCGENAYPLMAVHGEELHAMVSNLGQTDAGYYELLNFRAGGQEFRTGPNGSGYYLQGIGVNIEGSGSELPGGPGDVRVSLYTADAAGKPVTKLFDLVSPDQYKANSRHFFEAPPGAELYPNTSYVMVWENLSMVDHRLRQTASNGEDSGALTGFSIGENTLGGLTVNTLSAVDVQSLEIAVYGGANAPLEPPTYQVTKDWLHIPDGVEVGDQFRMLFVSTWLAMTDAKSGNVEVYNAHVQDLAAWHYNDRIIESAAPEFQAVVCTGGTEGVDARDNTAMTDATGVPIHWLDGGWDDRPTLIADTYDEFYSGAWKNSEWGAYVFGNSTQLTANREFWTGCTADGTAHPDAHLGNSPMRSVAVGTPGHPNANYGPLGAVDTSKGFVSTDIDRSRAMYGISPIFTVVAGGREN